MIALMGLAKLVQNELPILLPRGSNGAALSEIIFNFFDRLIQPHSITDNYRVRAQRIQLDLSLTSALICIRLLCIHGFFYQSLYRERDSVL